MVELKGGLIRDILERIEADTSPQGRSIVDRIAESTRARIRECMRTDWLDSEYMMDLDQALLDVLGEEGFVNYWKSFAVEATEIPVLRPIFSAAMRMFVSPGMVAKSLPRVYGAMVRGTGRMTFELVGYNEAVFTMHDCGGFTRPSLFGLANLGGIRGGFELAGAEANVEFELLEHGSTGRGGTDQLALRFPIWW